MCNVFCLTGTTSSDQLSIELPRSVQEQHKLQVETLERQHTQLQAEAHDRIQSLEALVRELRDSVESASASSEEKSAMLSEEITALKGKVSSCLDGMRVKQETMFILLAGFVLVFIFVSVYLLLFLCMCVVRNRWRRWTLQSNRVKQVCKKRTTRSMV